VCGLRFARGDTIADRYQIDESVGSGAFGEVYRAHSDRFGEVAIKILPSDLPTTRAGLVLKEASILAELEHPNIVKVFEVGQHSADGIKCEYLVMEFLAGGTLSSYLERNVRLSVEEARRVGCAILSALACAHSLEPPVIHGDVKPANILLVSEDPLQVKVADFGLSDRACPVTGIASAAGTLSYLAPECLWGYAVPGSDVFSAGLLIYQLLTGTAAFALPELDEHATDKEWRRAVEHSRQNPPPPPSAFNKCIHKCLDQVVLQALALDHRERYASAGDFLEALAVTAHGPVLVEAAGAERVESSIDQSIPVFGLDDYRLLACSGDLTQDEMNALWDLYRDIETPIAVDAGGAFSVVASMGVTRTELSRLNGSSLSDWLFHNETSIPELRILKDIGKLMYSNPYSQRAVRCGMLLYASAIAQGLEKHGERISALTLSQLQRLFSDLLSWPFLPPKYRSLLSRANVVL